MKDAMVLILVVLVLVITKTYFLWFKKTPTLRMTVCPDLKFWSILFLVFANTALILKEYVCGISVV